MAKRIFTWTETESVLTVTGTDDPALSASFDIVDLYEEWNNWNEAQRGFVVNGVKQRLTDKTEWTPKVKMTAEERVTWMKETWARAVDEGLYRAPAATRTKNTVSYTDLIPSIKPLQDVGFDAEKIAETLHMPIEIVNRVLEG